MIKLEKKDCCGCESCKNICPKNCIEIIQDEEGFTYPAVDEEQCVKCGLCVKKCPAINYQRRDKSQCRGFVSYNKDSEVLENSSSGGVFWELVKYVIAQNGKVYGAENYDGRNVCTSGADTLEECKKYRKSKYIQSEMRQSYIHAKEDLDSGRLVLFSGTPCHIAGLYTFLGRDYDNLYSVDVVCHGVPSKKVYNMYLDAIEQKYKSEVKEYCWRDKREGWRPNHLSIKLENGEELYMTSKENPCQKGFLDNLYLRKSCYECKYNGIPRVADISLADAWGYKGNLADKHKNRGLSYVILSSEKGGKIFDCIKEFLIYEEVEIEKIVSGSRHVSLPPEKSRVRERFFEDLNTNGRSFQYIQKKYIFYERQKKYKMKSYVKRVINKIYK